MKISKLPEPLKELALKRQRENPIDKDTNLLESAFQWDETLEGRSFWCGVYNGHFKVKIKKDAETKHEKLMRRLNKAVELHKQAQNYDLSERRVRLCTYLYEKRNKYLRELIYTPIRHSDELPFN